MENKNEEKFLFQLSVKEFEYLIGNALIEILPRIIQEELKSIKDLQPILEENDTLSVKEAAKLTGMQPKTLYSKVCRSEMPSLTRGRPLIFSKKDLMEWLRKGKPTVGKMLYDEYMKK